MERQPKATTLPPSGIPRVTSRLPLPTSTVSKSVRPSPSRERLQADPGLDARRLRRPSHETLLKKPLSRYSSPAKPQSNAPPTQNGLQDVLESGSELDPPAEEDVSASLEEEEASPLPEDRGRRRQERPSLSDRTIETLSQIPPSPVSVRRQSSFFNGASPIRSPSRTPSTVSAYSQSPSRSSSAQNGHDIFPQPVSKLRLPSRSRASVSSSRSTNNTPDFSTVQDAASSEISSPVKKTAALFAKPSAFGVNKEPVSSPRPSPAKVSKKPSKSNMGPPEQPLHVQKTRKSPAKPISTAGSPSAASRYVSASSHQDDLSSQQLDETEERKAVKSSSALRESIAKAKAARMAAATGAKKSTPQAAPANAWASIDVEDPFNQLPKGSNPGVLRKRVETARASGQLNIAALSLTEIPQEVLAMYDFDPNASDNWFENVDLVKFIAADNDLAEIPDAAFPDMDPENFDPDSDERGPQFRGVETLDLHGNVLRTLPMGLRRLQQLHSLNLSNNSLEMENIHVVFEIPSLTDLKLANNGLQGPFPSATISSLVHLESLDLHGNNLTELPEDVAELTALKTLDVAENQLTSLPFDALSKLPLKSLNAPKNKLEGTLIPSSVHHLGTLQSLNIVNNAVEEFATNETLDCPSLHSLFIGVNRIKRLPCVSSWQSLLILSAEENSLTELPVGFAELKNVKNVDFTGNDISRLDEKIGLMESLTSFRIANNPLRERRLLSMDTDDLKRDMRTRCEPDPQDTDDEGSVATQFTLAPETPTLDSNWRIGPGGVLDKSHSDMTDLEADKLEMIPYQDIRSLYLQHNELRCFPMPAITMVAQGLVDLDLSHNPLNASELISSPLEMPKLQTLNLSAARLTSLEPLLINLTAPSLNFLDISNNRLRGPLPHLRQRYTELKTVLAGDNQIASLEFEAAQGLQFLDISNNDIDFLPPKIGLLAAERSTQNWGTGSPLRRFEVAGNRFRVPRWQTVAKGTDAILEFLRDRIPTHELPEWENDHEVHVDEL